MNFFITTTQIASTCYGVVLFYGKFSLRSYKFSAFSSESTILHHHVLAKVARTRWQPIISKRCMRFLQRVLWR